MYYSSESGIANKRKRGKCLRTPRHFLRLQISNHEGNSATKSHWKEESTSRSCLPSYELLHPTQWHQVESLHKHFSFRCYLHQTPLSQKPGTPRAYRKDT